MRQLVFGKRAGLFALALFLAAASGAWSAPAALAYNTYAQYARALLGKLPADAIERPDLEAYLDRLASSYRRSKGRGGLVPSELMREAARAQAIDIMLAGKSGHRSRAGHSFDQRFAAYVDATEIYPARGENAASDRKRGPVDEAKARGLFAQWLDSSSHRRNLMKRDYEFVSSGVFQRGDELWAVQIFWSKPVPASDNQLIIGIGQ